MRFLSFFFFIFVVTCIAQIRKKIAKDNRISSLIPKISDEIEISLTNSDNENIFGGKFQWKLYQIDDRTSLEDIKMLPDGKMGVIAAEVGKIYKTKDGGKSWEKILDLGFPYYFYGVSILNSSYIVASGFNNNVKENGGYVTISKDGGKNFSTPVKLTTNWFQFAQNFDVNAGILLSEGGVFISMTSGEKFEFIPIPGSSWWGDGFTMFSSKNAIISGLDHLCVTKDLKTWSCMDPISDVNAGNFFFNESYGFVGSGWIDPTVEGWIRKTNDSGKTWSDKLVETPYPVRDIMFYDDLHGFAIGGNFFSGVGGVYFTSDGGKTWELEVDTKCEMKGISIVKTGKFANVWIVGSSPSQSVVYSTKIDL